MLIRNRLDPLLLEQLFIYHPKSGTLTIRPKQDTAPTAVQAVRVRRISTSQYQIDDKQVRLHRIVWAMHHPENPNPRYVRFADGNTANTRIENLRSSRRNPRWLEHYSERRALQNPFDMD